MTFCYLENISKGSILIKNKEAKIPLVPGARVSIDTNTHKLLEAEIRLFTRSGDVKMIFPDSMFKNSKPASKVELKEVEKDSTPVKLEDTALDIEEEEHIKMKAKEEPKVQKKTTKKKTNKKSSNKKEEKVTLK